MLVVLEYDQPLFDQDLLQQHKYFPCLWIYAF